MNHSCSTTVTDNQFSERTGFYFGIQTHAHASNHLLDTMHYHSKHKAGWKESPQPDPPKLCLILVGMSEFGRG